MVIGGNYIHKAYYGLTELTPTTAFLGEEPLIEDLEPDIWYPFSSDLANHGKLDLSAYETGGNAVINTLTLDSTNHFAATQNKTTIIETSASTHPIYASQRTIESVTYPANELTVTLWVRLTRDRLTSWYGSGKYFSDTDVRGYLSNNVFYSDSGLTTIIPADREISYYNLLENSRGYYWNGTDYIACDSEDQYGEDFEYYYGIIGGNRHYYTKFGFVGNCRATNRSFNKFRWGFQARNNGEWTAQWHTLKLDTWMHIAFIFNPTNNNYLKILKDGVKVYTGNISSSAINYDCWRLQSEGRLGGNYYSIHLPFDYKDVRIYGRNISEEGVKYLKNLL